MHWIEEIRHDISTIQSTPDDLKKFGLTIGSVLLLLSGVAFWKGWWSEAALISICAISVSLILSGIFFTQILRAIHYWWMSFAIILGSIVSRIVLLIVFFLIVTSISLVSRMFGKKFYITHHDHRQSSYWIRRDQSKHINYDRMS